jgi:hypothetical protein
VCAEGHDIRFVRWLEARTSVMQIHRHAPMHVSECTHAKDATEDGLKQEASTRKGRSNIQYPIDQPSSSNKILPHKREHRASFSRFYLIWSSAALGPLHHAGGRQQDPPVPLPFARFQPSPFSGYNMCKKNNRKATDTREAVLDRTVRQRTPMRHGVGSHFKATDTREAWCWIARKVVLEDTIRVEGQRRPHASLSVMSSLTVSNASGTSPRNSSATPNTAHLQCCGTMYSVVCVTSSVQ